MNGFGLARERVSRLFMPGPDGMVPTWPIALIVALIGTIVFYTPLLATLQPGNVAWPGFMLSHDQRVFYFPSFVEGYRRFWSEGLLGIDFFTGGGASVFSFRPNLLPFYPPYIIAYLLVDCSDLKSALVAYILIFVIHHFACLFFAITFCRKYLSFSIPASILASFLYCLGAYAGLYIVFSTFYFQMTLVPVNAYAIAWLMRTTRPSAAVLVSPLFVLTALSNYVPTMAASLAASIIVALISLATKPQARARPYAGLLNPILSLLITVAVTVPYFYGQLRFKGLMAPTVGDLQHVAYSLALSGYDLINGFSKFIHINRAQTEGELVWGLTPTLVFLFGLDVILRGYNRDSRLSFLAGSSFIVYVAVILVSLGTSLITASTTFYYLFPVLGDMHIYHRYLIFFNIFFAISVSAMALIVMRYASPKQKLVYAYIGLAVWILVSIAALYFGANNPFISSNELMTEAFLLAIAMVAIAIARPNTALLTVAICCALPSLYTSQTIQAAFSRPENVQIEPVPLSQEYVDLVGFLAAESDGESLPTVAIATPKIESYFSRNLPWLIGNDRPIGTFQGYPNHLSFLASYSGMGTRYAHHDLEWLRVVGTDFIAWNAGSPQDLDPFIQAGFDITTTLELPFQNRLSKVRYIPSRQPILQLTEANTAWPEPYALDGWAIEGQRLLKLPGGVENRFGFPVAQVPGETYDITFEVDPGSRGHLVVAFGNKVVSQLDVDGPRFFTTRVTTEGPGDLWITASPDFQGSLSNVVVTPAPPGPESRFDNGILRVDLPPDRIHDFSTNFSNRIHLDIDAPSPTKVTYLLWPNPYMVPYVDGVRVAWSDPEARPLSIEVGPGAHRIEIRFKSRPATAFRLSMLAYGLLLLATVAWPLARRTGILGNVPDGARLDWPTARAGMIAATATVRKSLADAPAATGALILLLITTALTLVVNFGVAELLTSNPWNLPYVGELPDIRSNDLARLMAASEGFTPQTGVDAVMPGEAVPYPPLAFLLFGMLAALPERMAWVLFYLPALFYLRVAGRFSAAAPMPHSGAAWYAAILLSYPFLYVLDRANIDLYVGLLCFFGLALLARGRTGPAALAIGVAGALKIYPVVLLCLFVRRDHRALAIGVAAGAATTLLAMLVLQQGPGEALAFLSEHLGRTATCFQAETRCLNLSFSVPFKLLFASVVTFEWYPALWTVAEQAYGVISLLLGLAAMAHVMLRPGRLWLDALRLTLVMTLLPVMSYDYKLLLFLGPLFLALLELRDGRADRYRGAAIVLMAVMLSSWKWLGQDAHLWIHAIAQLLLLGLAIVTPGVEGKPSRDAQRVRRLAGGAVTAVAFLVVWNTVGNSIVRQIWSRTTAWCPAELTYSDADPIPIWGDGWAAFEGPPESHWRWTLAQTAELFLPVKGETSLSGMMALPPGSPDGTVLLRSDRGAEEAVAVPAGQAAPFTLTLREYGLTRVAFVAPALRSADGRGLGLVVSGLRIQATCP